MNNEYDINIIKLDPKPESNITCIYMFKLSLWALMIFKNFQDHMINYIYQKVLHRE